MKLLPLEEVVHRLEWVISSSPCDETELVWVEIVRASVSDRDRENTPPHAEATVLVRVRDAERIGVYQTGAGTVGELSNAVRQALGQTRIESPSSWRCPPAPPDEKVEVNGVAVDRELAGLEPQAARELLGSLCRPGEAARLDWNVGRVVLANSRGLQQQAAATSVVLEARCPGSAGTGRAAAAARSFAALDREEVFARARRRRADRGDDDGSEVGWHAPLVLSPEAVIALLALLNQHALSARSFHEGTSVLQDAVGKQIFDPELTLVDDGMRSGQGAQGLPFPFDLFGYGKRPVEMIRDSRLQTPAVDQELAEQLDLPPTPHGVAQEDSRASHLWMDAGSLSDRELFELADGGLWIGWLEHLECLDAAHGRFRARARGTRRIVGGELGAGIPDMTCRGSFPEIFERLAGVGRETVCLPVEDGFRGGIVAPAIALPEGSALEVR